MFNPILVPLDGSSLAECVLPHARAIARAFDSKVMLLRVMDKSQSAEDTQIFDLVNWQINKAGARLYLDKMSTRLQKTGMRVETTILEGPVADTITKYAQNKGSKLIFLSSYGRSGLHKWGISSIAHKVIFNAPTSVLIIRAQGTGDCGLDEQRYTQIMVPLDGSRRAENVLPQVTLLARQHHARIHIVHVVRTPDMARQLPLASEDIELSNRFIARNREEASRYLDSLRGQSILDGIDVKIHLLTSSNTPATLHDLMDQEHIDLVSLNAHGHTGNDKWPYGGMVNNFILYSRVPLLIVQDLPTKEEEPEQPKMPTRKTIEL